MFTDDEIDMMRLANLGLIPHDAVDWDLMKLKRLVNLGLVPRAAVIPSE